MKRSSFASRHGRRIWMPAKLVRRRRQSGDRPKRRWQGAGPNGKTRSVAQGRPRHPSNGLGEAENAKTLSVLEADPQYAGLFRTLKIPSERPHRTRRLSRPGL
jgi:hypothetical protein